MDCKTDFSMAFRLGLMLILIYFSTVVLSEDDNEVYLKAIKDMVAYDATLTANVNRSGINDGELCSADTSKYSISDPPNDSELKKIHGYGKMYLGKFCTSGDCHYVHAKLQFFCGKPPGSSGGAGGSGGSGGSSGSGGSGDKSTQKSSASPNLQIQPLTLTALMVAVLLTLSSGQCHS